MSSPPVQHPADRLLIAFNLGKLDNAKAAAVNKHLKGCQTCRRRLVKLSAELNVPDAPKDDPALGVGPEAFAAAVQSDYTEGPTTLRSASLGWPRFVWPSVAVCALLFGLVIAWGAGAFKAKTSAAMSTVESRTLSIEPQAPKLTDQSPSIPPSGKPTTTIPSPTAVPSSRPAPQVPAVKETPKVEHSPAPAPQIAAIPERPRPPVPPADAKSNEAKSASQEFFNHKDLAGWHGSPAIWHVADASIIGSLPAGQKQSAFLLSEQRYKDFDLRFRASVADGIGDCSVQFRSLVTDSEKPQVVGPACAIYGKDAPKEHRTGSLVTEPQSKVEKAPSSKRVERFVKPAENLFRVRCQGKHILIEVNGIKMVNDEFPSLPEEGVIAWRIDASRPPHKVIFKITKFTDLTGLPSQHAPERPSLGDGGLLKAELKFESAVKKADETLLKGFDNEIKKLQQSRKAQEKELVGVVEHEKETFKEKGLVPFSRPMRKPLLQYAKGLREAQGIVGKAFDSAIDHAEKNHNDHLKEALLGEAAEVLTPREVAKWQVTDGQGQAHRTIFYSDGTFVGEDHPDQTSSRFWAPPTDDDMLILEFPDGKDPTATMRKVFLLTLDGKTLKTRMNGQDRFWQHVED